MNTQHQKTALSEITSSFNAELSKSEAAKKYLKERGLSEESIIDFGLGLAPEGWNFSDSISNGEYSFDIKKSLEEVGIIKKSKKGGKYDFFRGRIMFPVMVDTKDDCYVAGFTGRRLSDNQEGSPKYLHSQVSELFRRNDILYNWKDSATKDIIFLTEGVLDVILLAQLGIKNVVASLGTQISDTQISKLVQFKTIAIWLDSDNAGVKATAKLIGKILKINPNQSIAVIQAHDSQLDPADIAQKCDTVKDIANHVSKLPIEEFIAKYAAMEASEQLIDIHSQFDQGFTVEGMSLMIKIIEEAIPDPTKQEIAIDWLEELT